MPGSSALPCDLSPATSPPPPIFPATLLAPRQTGPKVFPLREAPTVSPLPPLSSPTTTSLHPFPDACSSTSAGRLSPDLPRLSARWLPFPLCRVHSPFCSWLHLDVPPSTPPSPHPPPPSALPRHRTSIVQLSLFPLAWRAFDLPSFLPSLMSYFLGIRCAMFAFKNPLTATLDSWLSRLKYWFRPVHSCESQGDIGHIEQTSCPTFNPTVLSPPSPLSIDLPSRRSDLDPESFEIGSGPSSTPSSRCHTPLEDPYAEKKALRHPTRLSISKLNSKALSTNSTTTSSARRYTLLGEYSLQELVLLEFITHTSDVQPADIDDLLLRYPPGFSRVCRCAGMVEDLCELCQLLDAYMDYSLERFRGTSSAA
ncbi:hypothetical protein JB92DRAFT_3127040 [Gautieria morchelliformis]|nr:hypothetical protein JB92DRAFT_3127040 [Gautieria morchelliformis]